MKLFFRLLLLAPLSLLAQPDFDQAEKLFRSGDYERSAELFRGCLARNPDNVKPLEYLGDIHAIAKQWEKAADCYKRLASLKPGNAEFHYKYGGALAMDAASGSRFRALGMISGIRDSFQQAIRLNPKHINARWALIEYYLQLPAVLGGSESRAVSYACELEKLSAVDGHLAKGRIEEYFGRYAKAEKHYLKAHAIGNSETTYKKLLALYTRTRHAEKARALSENYIKSTQQRNNST